jgi:hypothetical protein
MDVNARAWNFTGLTVKKGETYRIEVKEGGLIVWRSGILLNDTAPPEGDSTVNPGNTLLWVEPPIHGGAIGMLIGAIWPVKGDPPPGPTVPITSLFRVQGGRIVTMDADGWLFLGVNDGVLSNNAGCFQVRITKLK